MLKSKIFKKLVSIVLIVCLITSVAVVISNTTQKAEASSKLGDIFSTKQVQKQ